MIERMEVYERIRPWVEKYGGWAILVLSANAIQQLSDEKETERTNELLESIRDILDKRLP